jgi:hypothetical protein
MKLKVQPLNSVNRENYPTRTGYMRCTTHGGYMSFHQPIRLYVYESMNQTVMWSGLMIEMDGMDDRIA